MPGDRQRRRGADQRDDVGIVLEIVAQHGADDLRLVEEARREERPDRPVDQARGQRLLFRRPALALEEAAGDLAGGEGLFLVVDGEREEILAGLRRLCRRPRCTAPSSRRRSPSPRHRPGGRSCRSRARGGGRPTSALCGYTSNISLLPSSKAAASRAARSPVRGQRCEPRRCTSRYVAPAICAAPSRAQNVPVARRRRSAASAPQPRRSISVS